MTTDPPRSPSVSRYFLIVAAYGVAIYQASRGHWFEVAGLAGLGTGLVMLILAPKRPVLRWLAWVCFAVTVAAVIHVAQRDY